MPRAEKYVFTAWVAGHLIHSEVYTGKGRENLSPKLAPAEVFTFDPTRPLQQVDSRGTRIELPAEALVDAQGKPPAGPVSAYNLAPGKKATLALRTLPGHEGEVPLWWYDTAQGQWREEGSALVKDGVATGEVSHFTVWNVDMKFSDSACLQIKVDPQWFSRQGYSFRNPLLLEARMSSQWPRYMSLSIEDPAEPHVLYNMEPDTVVELLAGGQPLALVNVNGAWGGTGLPAYPYDACKGKVLLDGTPPSVATLQGQVQRQHRTEHSRTKLDVSVGSSTFTTFTDATGNFSLSVPVGTATLTASRPVELFVPRAEPYVISASARGHRPHSEVYIGPARGSLRLRLSPAESFTFNASQPLDQVDSRGTRLVLPANALVNASGQPPSGPVTVSMSTYDVGSEPMVGDMSGVDASGRPVALISLGAVSVEFTDEAGTPYNLASGMRARLSLASPPGVNYEGTVPLWWFDTQAGVWREEGQGSVTNGVATGEVSHFTVWNFDLKLDNPACIKLEVDAAWFSGQGYNSRNPLPVEARVTAPWPSTRRLDIADVDAHVLYNLSPDATVEFYVAGQLHSVVGAGAAWGGSSGFPAYPYNECKGSVRIDGTPKVGSLVGRVLRQHRGEHSGVRIQASPGGQNYSATTGADGSFSLQLPVGTYTLTASRPGYLSAQRSDVAVAAGAASSLTDVTLTAGDVDDSRCVDAADMALINDTIPLTLTGDDARDLDGDSSIGFNDLRLAAGNGRQCGPLAW